MASEGDLERGLAITAGSQHATGRHGCHIVIDLVADHSRDIEIVASGQFGCHKQLRIIANPVETDLLRLHVQRCDLDTIWKCLLGGLNEYLLTSR